MEVTQRSKEPKFTVVESHGDIEIRDYDSFLIAKVKVAGERREALRAGFRVLADFIFGNNRTKTKIAMNIPVTQQGKNDLWEIHFMMPRGETIPGPNNAEIEICKVQPQRMAVIVFSGIPSDNKINLNTQRLEKFCQERGLQIGGSPIFAFYNPPWTLPFLRRNEVMFVLGPPKNDSI